MRKIISVLAALALLFTTNPLDAAHVGSGAAVPATCTVGDTFTLLPIGDVYLCNQTNTWGRRDQFSMGEVNYFNTTGTAITIAGVSDGSTNLVKVAVTTAFVGHRDFDNGGGDNGRLRYIGNETRMFHTALTTTLNSTNNDEFVIVVAKNGSATAVKTIQTGGSSRNGNALHAVVSLATNDYIEVYVGNMTAARNPTFYSLNIVAMGMQ